MAQGKSKVKTQKSKAKGDQADRVPSAFADPFDFCVLTFDLPWLGTGHRGRYTEREVSC
jgi:hypothetical protein